MLALAQCVHESRAMGQYLHCRICKKRKSIHAFDRDRKKVTGRRSECKQCRADYWKNYSKTLVRDDRRRLERLSRIKKVGGSPCETGCPLFERCANACHTCQAYRSYAEENCFEPKEIAKDLSPC